MLVALLLLTLQTAQAQPVVRRAGSLKHAIQKVTLGTESRNAFKTAVKERISTLPWMIQRPAALDAALAEPAETAAVGEALEHQAQRFAFAMIAEPSELNGRSVELARAFGQDAYRQLSFSAGLARNMAGVTESLRRVRGNLDLFDASDGGAWTEADVLAGAWVEKAREAEKRAARGEKEGRLLDAAARFKARGAASSGYTGPGSVRAHPRRGGH